MTVALRSDLVLGSGIWQRPSESRERMINDHSTEPNDNFFRIFCNAYVYRAARNPDGPGVKNARGADKTGLRGF